MKKEYKVLITETYQKTVIVEAESEAQARTRARDAWQNTECVVETECFTGVEFYVAGESESGEEDKRIQRINGKDALARPEEGATS